MIIVTTEPSNSWGEAGRCEAPSSEGSAGNTANKDGLLPAPWQKLRVRGVLSWEIPKHDRIGDLTQPGGPVAHRVPCRAQHARPHPANS